MRYFWLAFLLLIGLNGPAYAATGISAPTDVLVTIWSSDGATLAGGSGGNLITIAGTWTFGSPAVAGNYPIQLNGVNQGGPAAATLYILNGGTLYQQTATNVWWSWVGAGPWTGPVPDPRNIAGGCLAGSICPPGNWSIAFNDEFNSSTINNNVWVNPPGLFTGRGRATCCNNQTNLTVNPGGDGLAHFHLTAGSNPPIGSELSTIQGLVLGNGTVCCGPGYYEARMRTDTGHHDTFWGIANTDSACQPLTAGAEFDIIENPEGGDGQHIHWSGYGGCHQSVSSGSIPSSSDGMHIWGMLWDATSGYTFYRDGVQTYQVPGPVNNGSNKDSIVLSVDTDYPGNGDNQQGMLVDWVRYYQPSTVSVPAGAHAAGLQR
jgi:hypothetical protein